MNDQTKPNRQTVAQMIRAEPYNRLLFTFNELMEEAAIRELCPEPKFVSVVRYPSTRFIINADGAATVVGQRNSVVYGVVWQIDELSLAALDIAMGVPSIYDRTGGFKRDLQDRLVVAEHYVARERRLGLAEPSYLAPIVEAACKYEFPKSYIEELRLWDRG